MIILCYNYFFVTITSQIFITIKKIFNTFFVDILLKIHFLFILKRRKIRKRFGYKWTLEVNPSTNLSPTSYYERIIPQLSNQNPIINYQTNYLYMAIVSHKFCEGSVFTLHIQTHINMTNHDCDLIKLHQFVFEFISFQSNRLWVVVGASIKFTGGSMSTPDRHAIWPRDQGLTFNEGSHDKDFVKMLF